MKKLIIIPLTSVIFTTVSYGQEIIAEFKEKIIEIKISVNSNEWTKENTDDLKTFFRDLDKFENIKEIKIKEVNRTCPTTVCVHTHK